MSWLRVEDGFTENKKVLALPRKDRWTWLEVLTYCARQRNGGIISDGICDVLRWVTPAFLRRCVDAGLLEVIGSQTGSREPKGNHFAVHDWSVYNAVTLEERVASYIDSNPDANANDVHRAVGGKRQVVLSIVAAIRDNQPVPGNRPGGSPAGSQSVPLARARAPRPLPQPQQSFGDTSPSTEVRPPANGVPSDLNSETETAFAITELMGEINAPEEARVRLRRYLERAEVAPFVLYSARDELRQRRAKAPALKNEAGYVRRIVERYVKGEEKPAYGEGDIPIEEPQGEAVEREGNEAV